MTDKFEMWDAVTDAGSLLLLAILIGGTSLVLLSPVAVLTGDADGWRDHAAGAIGIGFWVFTVAVFGGVL